MLDEYNQVFEEIFNVKSEQLKGDFSKETVDNWDSVLQLALVEALEDVFDIMLDTDDILNFTSYKVGKDILSKYDIKI